MTTRRAPNPGIKRLVLLSGEGSATGEVVGKMDVDIGRMEVAVTAWGLRSAVSAGGVLVVRMVSVGTGD